MQAESDCAGSASCTGDAGGTVAGGRPRGWRAEPGESCLLPQNLSCELAPGQERKEAERVGSGPCVTWGSREDATSPCVAGVGSSKRVTALRPSGTHLFVLSSAQRSLPPPPSWTPSQRCSGGSGRCVRDGQVPHRSSGAGRARPLCRVFHTRQSLLWPQSIARFLHSLPDTRPRHALEASVTFLCAQNLLF